MPENKGLSRREFMKVTGIAGAGSILGPAGPVFGAGEGGEKKELTAVPVRPFGKTGVQVSCLGLGGMFDIPSNQILLRLALKWGVTYWDTADCYEGGNSELGIGQFFKKNPDAREKVFLVTKSDKRDPKGLSELLERSLQRMNTDRVDLYFVHGISDISEINGDTKAWVERAKLQKKIRFFGFSAHSNMEECMTGAAKLGWIDGIMITYNYRLMQTEKMKAAVDACVKAGIGLTAMKTQGGGSIKDGPEALLDMAGRFLKQGFSDKQAKLKAIWENPDIACICSQMPNMTILTANIAAAMNQKKLSAADFDYLERYSRETSSTYCAGCTRICEPAAGEGAPVGDVLRCLMYHNSYGDPGLARSVFSEIPPEKRDRLLQLDYSAAEAVCPQRIAIGELVREALELFA
jgi:uncharacterized protein